MAGKKSSKGGLKSETSKHSSSKSKITKKVSDPSSSCEKHYFGDEEIKSVQRNLLDWYDRNQRTLPWRTIAKLESDPNIRGYAVWVSEVMLQQTQVATVIPYFNTWMEKWPNVQALANANVDEVLKVWAGLGYYSRGRRLHEGAQIIMDKLQGQIPNTVPDLTKLIPGIGAYSASAIASIAFQKPVGVVDGNVIRVLSRLKIIGANVTQTSVRDHLWDLANKVVSKEKPGDFNQAVMELGATICTPQNPNCSACPLRENCGALAMTKTSTKIGKLDAFLQKNVAKCVKPSVKNPEIDIEDIGNGGACSWCIDQSVWKESPQVTTFPCKVEKKPSRQEKVNVLVIEKEGQFLMMKRPEKGLLAGLWEFPSVVLECDSGKNRNLAVEGIAKDLEFPKTLLSTRRFVGEVIHLFSHIHTTYLVEHIISNALECGEMTNERCTWYSSEEIKTAAVSTAMKKVLALVKNGNGSTSKDPKNKKRKRTPDSLKQKSIKSFFS